MGITDLREQLKDLAGSANLTMSYEDGGRVETYHIGETIVSVGAGSTAKVIREAFEAPVIDSVPVGGATGSSIPTGDELVERVSLAIKQNIDAALPAGYVIDYRYAALAAIDAVRGGTA